MLAKSDHSFGLSIVVRLRILTIALLAVTLNARAEWAGRQVASHSYQGEYGTGLHPVVEQIGGIPAMLYIMGPDLFYVRALDPEGLNWGAPVKLPYHLYPGYSHVPIELSLAEIGGKPAAVLFSLEQSRQGSFYTSAYYSALDSAGSAWDAAVPQLGFGGHLNLVEVGGLPAVYSTVQVSDHEIILYFRRALDAKGNTWGESIALGTAPFKGPISATLIGGKPAVAWCGTRPDIGDDRPGILLRVANDANGGDWSTPAVKVPPTLNYETSPALCELDGRPAVAYFAVPTTGTMQSVYFRHALDASGTSWGEAKLIDADALAGSYSRKTSPHLRVADGALLLRYELTEVSGEFGEIIGSVSTTRVARSTNLEETWSPPAEIVTGGVDFDGDVDAKGNWPSAGWPCFAVYGGLQKGLVFVGARDAAGAAWREPQVVVAEPPPSGPMAVALIGGKPAVVYDQGRTSERYFSRSRDSAGNGWCAEAMLAPPMGGAFGGECRLAEVGGRPAVASVISIEVQPSVRKSLPYYARSADAAGVEWNPFLPANLGEASDIALAEVEGLPALIYASRPPGEAIEQFFYVRALDADGLAWGPPVELHQAAATGNALSVTIGIVEGRPAVTFKSGTDVFYRRASDPQGDQWGGVRSNFLIADGRPVTQTLLDGYPLVASGGHYVVANDHDGVEWNDPINWPREETLSARAPLTMAIIDGVPAFSAKDVSLIYQQKSKASGWIDLQVVESFSASSPIVPTAERLLLLDAGDGPLLFYGRNRYSHQTYVRSLKGFPTGTSKVRTRLLGLTTGNAPDPLDLNGDGVVDVTDYLTAELDETCP